jgi:hypothetical protein
VNALIIRAHVGKTTEQNGTLNQQICTRPHRKSQAALPDSVQAWRLFLFVVGATWVLNSALEKPISSSRWCGDYG